MGDVFRFVNLDACNRDVQIQYFIFDFKANSYYELYCLTSDLLCLLSPDGLSL